MAIITRSVGPNAKGGPLTNVELDENFLYLESLSLPLQTGNAGKVLMTNGTIASWQKIRDEQTFSHNNLDGNGVLTVVHDLNEFYPNVVIYDESNQIVTPGVVRSLSASTITVDLSDFGTFTGTWRVITK